LQPLHGQSMSLLRAVDSQLAPGKSLRRRRLTGGTLPLLQLQMTARQSEARVLSHSWRHSV